jgi:hypothetical protein
MTGNPVSTGGTSAGGTGQETLYTVTQEHPILDGFTVGDEINVEPGLTSWIAWFDDYVGEGVEVIADVGRTTDGIMGSGIGVQERANNRHVLLSNHSQTSGRGPNGWSDDAEQIFWNAIDWSTAGEATFECVPVEGGLVLGQVRDENTGDGVNSATVASDGNPDESTTSFATPDDPALDDGFYWMFSSLTGDQQFTASAGNYVADTQTASVAADAATEADFSLAAGELTVDPTELDTTVRLGDSASETFTVTNTGTASAELEFDERLGGFEILGLGADQDVAGQPWQAADLQRNPDFDPNARTTEGKYLDGEVPRIRPSAPGDVITSFDPVGMSLAWGVGFDGDVWLADPTTVENHEFTVAGQPTGASYPASWAGTWNGDMAALNDQEMCQVNVGGDNGIYCWSKSSGDVTRSISGSFPWTSISQRGLAYRADDDTFYIGGWNDDTLYHVRGFSHGTPGEVISQCPYPTMGISGLAWNPTAEVVWIANNTQDDTLFQVDPGTCDVVGSLPHPTPGFNGGGLEMDDAGNLWMISQENNADNLVYLVDSGVPHASDVPWLSHDVETATLQPGDQVQVTVTTDSSAAEEGQPGAYAAGVGIRHDTPYAVDSVGVTMNVTPPDGWGKITGTVTGVTCEGEASPLSGATVQINGKTQEVHFNTGGEGTYAYWLPSKENPLTMIVAQSGYHPQTRDARIMPRKTVTEDFALHAVCRAGGDAS